MKKNAILLNVVTECVLSFVSRHKAQGKSKKEAYSPLAHMSAPRDKLDQPAVPWISTAQV